MSNPFWNRRRPEEVSSGMENVFHIIPASSGAFTTIWVISGAVVLVLVFVIALFGSLVFQAKSARFTVTDEGLRIGPGLYGRFIPRENIQAEGVKVIDLHVDKEYALAGKTNGSNLPGFNSGWFKLANKEKALVFITDKSRVVYIPTTDNYSVLLSTLHAEEMAGALQAWR